jgi:hypothetical protein
MRRIYAGQKETTAEEETAKGREKDRGLLMPRQMDKVANALMRKGMNKKKAWRIANAQYQKLKKPRKAGKK